MKSNSTLFIGKKHIVFDSIDSTNAYASELIANSNPIEGTVISAAYQTEGRGQIGRKWEGAQGQNIYSSIILRPNLIQIQDQFYLNKAISLGVSDAISNCINKKVKIKWPNDMYVENCKIAGILIQNTLQGKSIQSTIVGIGINVNQTSFSSDLPNPTSMASESNKSFNLETVLEVLFSSIENWYLKLRANQLDMIDASYLTALYKLEDFSVFKQGVSYFKGKIKGVDHEGKLKVEKNGMICTYNLSEIKMVI